MDAKPFVVSGIIQGLGIGLLFVPLSVTAFATLSPALRSEGTAVYTLVRNLGSSVGISMMEALDTHQAAVAHADMAGQLSPGSPVQSALSPSLGGGGRLGLDMLNGEITRQASMVGAGGRLPDHAGDDDLHRAIAAHHAKAEGGAVGWGGRG